MARLTSSNNTIGPSHTKMQDHNATNKLTPSSIPNLQPPCVANTRASSESNAFLSNLPPPASSSSTTTTPWYRHTQYQDEDEEDGETKDHGPLDMDLAGASTPLANRIGRAVSSSDPSNISISFMSPISKLDNLHLESEIDLQEEENNSNDDYENNDEFDLGDKTLANDSGSDVEFREDETAHPPVYINRRKRHHHESPDVVMITPRHETLPNETHDYDTFNDPDHHMSINTTASHSKLSFSNSDSTPCPVQPKRKKLKFKHSNDSTPSIRSQRANKLLNLSSSRKTDVNSIISQLNQQHHDSDLDEDDTSSSPPPSSSQFSAANKIQSTPISQSTPANSRSSTPPIVIHKDKEIETKSEMEQNQESTPKSDTSLPQAQSSEFGAPINGYKFVEPSKKPQYTYQTPNNNRHTSDLKHAYTRNDYTPLNSGKYEIVGEFPVTSAGLMDESNGDIHIGDKRINDPYFKRAPQAVYTPPPAEEESELTKEYFGTFKLPILPPNFEVQEQFSAHVLTQFVSQKSDIIEFYRLLTVPQGSILELLKSERIRWHPDKWAGRFIDGLVVHFNTRVLDRLSQVLNELIEEYK